VYHVQNILNIRNCTILTQRTDGEPVTTVTMAVAEVDGVRWAADRQTIVPIEDDMSSNSIFVPQAEKPISLTD
jgi:hypothetical protein